MCPLLKAALSNSATQDMEKAEVLNAFSISASTSKTSLQESQAPGISGKGWNEEDVPLVEEDLVREYLSTLDLFKFMDPDAPMSAKRTA